MQINLSVTPVIWKMFVKNVCSTHIKLIEVSCFTTNLLNVFGSELLVALLTTGICHCQSVYAD